MSSKSSSSASDEKVAACDQQDEAKQQEQCIGGHVVIRPWLKKRAVERAGFEPAAGRVDTGNGTASLRAFTGAGARADRPDRNAALAGVRSARFGAGHEAHGPVV